MRSIDIKFSLYLIIQTVGYGACNKETVSQLRLWWVGGWGACLAFDNKGILNACISGHPEIPFYDSKFLSLNVEI